MRRESQVRFCEGGGAKLPSATRLVILCRTREEADAALAEVRAWVGENGLALHPKRRMSATAGSRGKGSSSSATVLRPASVTCARRA